jgi:hypothetical protein
MTTVSYLDLVSRVDFASLVLEALHNLVIITTVDCVDVVSRLEVVDWLEALNRLDVVD